MRRRTGFGAREERNDFDRHCSGQVLCTNKRNLSQNWSPAKHWAQVIISPTNYRLPG
jgi:hypothetical protein